MNASAAMAGPQGPHPSAAASARSGPLDPLLDLVDFGLMLIDPQGQVRGLNRWLRERLGDMPDPTGRRLGEVWSGRIDPRLLLAVRACLDFGHSVRLSHAFHPMPLPLLRPGDAASDRMRHAVDVIASLPPGGAAVQCLLQVRDMSEIARRERILKEQARQLRIELQRATEAQHELGRQSLRFRELARLAPVGLFETDAQGQLTYCNDRCAQMLQLDIGRQLGRHWLSMLPSDEIVRLSPVWTAASGALVRLAEELCLDAGGVERWLRIEAGPILDARQMPSGFIGTVTDVTEFREHARRNEYRANHDSLTGLVNRERFAEQLRLAIAEARRLQRRVAILFIDLNRFKQINDEHGHAAGDTALKTAAWRIRRCMRGDDVVARLGGDEFAVLIPDAPDAASLERILAKLARAIAMPLTVGSGSLRMGCSVGMALYPDDAEDPALLLARADAQMYHRKRLTRQAGHEGIKPALRLVDAEPAP